MIRFILPVLSFWFLAGASPALAQMKLLPPIKVVGTLGELAGRPALSLGDGTRVHVGLETRKAPRDSAFLVYALVQGSHAGIGDVNPLGPLEVEIESRLAAKEIRDKVKRAMRNKLKAGGGKQSLFFASTVFVEGPGLYDLRLRGPEGNVVAVAIIEVTEEKVQPWLMFSAPAQLEDLPARQDDASRTALSLTPAQAALPRCDGSQPIPLPRGLNGVAGEHLLPRWHFGPDPEIRLKATPKSLEVTSKLPLDFSRLREQLLVRLWVNQKPFFPGEEDRQPLREALKIAETSATKFQIDMEFNPGHFGARKGDRIGIQLLLCPDGAELVRSGDRLDRAKEQQALREEARGRLPVVLGKAEFVVP